MVHAQVLRDDLVKVALAAGAKVYLATISVIGEEVNATNHAQLLEYANAMKSVAQEVCTSGLSLAVMCLRRCDCTAGWSSMYRSSHSIFGL